MTFTVVLISTCTSTCFPILPSCILSSLMLHLLSPPTLYQLLSFMTLLNTPSLSFLPPHFPPFLCTGLIAAILFDGLFVSSYFFSDGLGKTCWLSESGMHTMDPALLSGQQWAQPHQFLSLVKNKKAPRMKESQENYFLSLMGNVQQIQTYALWGRSSSKGHQLLLGNSCLFNCLRDILS